MPELAVFFGIAITIFYDDHDPPHVHASHGTKRGRFAGSEWVARIVIKDGSVLEGHIPARDLKLVRKWITLHQDEVLAAWQAARQGKPIPRVPPLRVR